MGCGKILLIFSTILFALLAFKISKLLEVPPIPDLPRDQWWGPGKPNEKVDKSIKPFKIEFTQIELDGLKSKLKTSDYFTAPLETIGFQYGFNNEYLKQVVDYWQNKYDFAARQNYLNKYPQFKTNIQGLDIHFVHVKPEKVGNAKVLPILLLHGWPGSFVEFHKTIPLLMKARPNTNFVFEVIVPSLPGYGYSQAAAKPGMGPAHVAVIFRNLMERLGHKQFIVQGGDWGSIIGGIMASLYPKNVYGYHTNMPVVDMGLSTVKLLIGSVYPSMMVEKEYEHKVFPVSNLFSFLIEEGGYFHLQATKPDTIGVALRDSPVGLAAYILEKFSTWTNPSWKTLSDGGLTKKLNMAEMLDNIMIYWDSKSITTSMRLYSEFFNKAHMALRTDSLPVHVPTAVARFMNEITFMTKWQLSGKYYNLVQMSTFGTGGHFAAFEEPELMANDIWEATKKFIEFHNKPNQK